jgi:hypothetical protein
MSQYEWLYNGGYGPLIKVMVYDKLTSDKIDLIDCEKMTKSPRLPQKSKLVSDLSSKGLECWDCSILEFEHHFLGSKTEEKFAVKWVVKRTDHELTITVLDLCILGTLVIDDLKRAKVLLSEA